MRLSESYKIYTVNPNGKWEIYKRRNDGAVSVRADHFRSRVIYQLSETTYIDYRLKPFPWRYAFLPEGLLIPDQNVGVIKVTGYYPFFMAHFPDGPKLVYLTAYQSFSLQPVDFLPEFMENQRLWRHERYKRARERRRLTRSDGA